MSALVISGHDALELRCPLTLEGGHRATGCELFREPGPQLGFLWGGMTMGMLLSVPLILAGLVLIWLALRRPPRQPA